MAKTAQKTTKTAHKFWKVKSGNWRSNIRRPRANDGKVSARALNFKEARQRKNKKNKERFRKKKKVTEKLSRRVLGNSFGN